MRYLVRTALLGLVLLVLPAAQAPGQNRTEKTDANVDRSLTGRVEKINAQNERQGTLVVRSSGAPAPAPGGKRYVYTFQISEQTQLRTPRGKELERGLQSPLLAGAEVRVTFIDIPPPPQAPGNRANQHMARVVQLIKPGEAATTK